MGEGEEAKGAAAAAEVVRLEDEYAWARSGVGGAVSVAIERVI
jgi:hypothetical protein